MGRLHVQNLGESSKLLWLSKQWKKECQTRTEQGLLVKWLSHWPRQHKNPFGDQSRTDGKAMLKLPVLSLCIEARKSGERWSVSWWWTANWWYVHRIGTQNSWTSSSVEASWSEWSWPNRNIPPWPQPGRKTWCAWWLSSQPCGHFVAEAYQPGRRAKMAMPPKAKAISKRPSMTLLPTISSVRHLWPNKIPQWKVVGGWATPLKNMNVNWDDYSKYMGE